jgi:immunity protein, SdpI family
MSDPMRRTYSLVLIAAAYLYGIALYGRLPERVPRHLSLSGNADAWTSRAIAVWLVPTIALGIWLVLRWLPAIDPRRANYAKFQGAYDFMVDATVTVLVAVHLGTLAAAIGLPVHVEQVAMAGLGFALVLIGNLLPLTRSNFFAGIRTPWTLSSDRVWERTHRFGGYLFAAAGVVTFVAAFLGPKVSAAATAISVGAAAVASVLYSYIVWRRERAA